jgi:hypothetical protein
VTKYILKAFVLYVPISIIVGVSLVIHGIYKYHNQEGPLVFVGTAILCSPMLIAIAFLFVFIYRRIDGTTGEQ